MAILLQALSATAIAAQMAVSMNKTATGPDLSSVANSAAAQIAAAQAAAQQLAAGMVANLSGLVSNTLFLGTSRVILYTMVHNILVAGSSRAGSSGSNRRL